MVKLSMLQKVELAWVWANVGVAWISAWLASFNFDAAKEILPLVAICFGIAASCFACLASWSIYKRNKWLNDNEVGNLPREDINRMMREDKTKT